MDPIALARHIVSEHPDCAEELYLLIVWATGNREDPTHEAQLDLVEAEVYAKTQDSIRHRTSYREDLMERTATTSIAISTNP